MRNRRTTRSVGLLAVLLLALTACGGSGNESAAGTPTTGDGEEAATTTTPATRSVDHFFGATDVPADPQRVIATDTSTLGNLLALDVPVVGAPLRGAATTTAYLADRVEGIEDLGTVREPDLEAAAALEPDLIVTLGADFGAELYDQFAQIAPTVGAEYGYSTVAEVETFLLAVGDAVGRQEQADQLARRLDERITELGARADAVLSGRPVTLLRVSQDNYSLRLGDTPAGLLEALGIERPEGQAFDPEEFSVDVSLEQIGAIDAHAIIVYTDSEAQDAHARLEQNQLWQNLEAVREGRVHFVENPGAWAIGIDILGVNVVLDEIDAFLADLETSA